MAYIRKFILRGLYFIFRDWADYEQGFGDFASPDGEYWLGNKNLHYLTSQGKLYAIINICYENKEQPLQASLRLYSRKR